MLDPLSYLYALVTDIRNWMFDHGWLHERIFSIPIVNVGNLAVGGTGKTPHTLWIVQQFIEMGYHPAVLSRGYGRKTKGFSLATATTTAAEIGDEPFELYSHIASAAYMAVCEDRRNGIERLLSLHPEIDHIVLDDAFQHRYVHPSLNILLTDFSRLYPNDKVLPVGRLRERAKGAERADVIIVTKCPGNLTATTREPIIRILKPRPHQQVLFSTVEYAPLPIDVKDRKILLITGIAQPTPLFEHIQGCQTSAIQHIRFRDHHFFTPSDVSSITAAAAEVDIVVTTRKDYSRLIAHNLPAALKSKLVVQDIKVKFLFDGERRMNQALRHL